MTSPKIAVYSLSDLKNSTDDALPNYLTSLKFHQSHYLVNVRLGLGYTAVVIAAVTFYADYKLGWDATKFWTLWAVIAYFVLNGALTYWIWGVEKGKIFTGGMNGVSISIASSVTKHKPVYNLDIQYGISGKEQQTLKLSAPFANWFDSDGYFVAVPFQRWLASEIPLVGQADPQKAGTNISNTAPQKTIEDTSPSAASSAGVASSPTARSRKSKKPL